MLNSYATNYGWQDYGLVCSTITGLYVGLSAVTAISPLQRKCDEFLNMLWLVSYRSTCTFIARAACSWVTFVDGEDNPVYFFNG